MQASNAVSNPDLHAPRSHPVVIRALVALAVMASGRAMTLAFIGRAGDGGAGDPPAAWLMPLIGDTVVGLSALAVAAGVWWSPRLAVWATSVAWTTVGAFDAIAAFLVDIQNPWPDFFMLETFGRSMFFAAVAVHVVILLLLSRPASLRYFGIADHSSNQSNSIA